jgi:hypothetical protein
MVEKRGRLTVTDSEQCYHHFQMALFYANATN